MIASPSLRPRRCSIESIRSEPKIRIRSSSSETKNFEAPGSPWRPERPRSWLSMRRLSCRSLPTTKSPPASTTPSCAVAISSRIAPACASSGHVGGDCHSSGSAGLRDDIGFLLVIACVQHVVRDLVLLEDRRERLGFFNADRADQHRLLFLLALQNMLHDCIVFLARRPVDFVVGVVSYARLVGRDLDHFELVD